MKIEKDIPLPDRGLRTGRWQKLMDKMENGDCVLLPYYEGKSFAASMYTNGVQPASRTEHHDERRMLRVWKMGVFNDEM